MIVDRIHECREHELCGMGSVYRETDDLSGIEVDDGGDIHESPLKRDVREVGTPDMVLVHGTGRHKEVRIDNLDIGGFLPLLTSPPVCFDAEEIHHSLHSLPVHREVDSETARAV